MECIFKWRKKTSLGLIDLPCGKCGACRHNRRSEWTFRIQQEMAASSSGHFITLTYSDDNLPWGDGVPSLDKTDLQKFIKRLRKALCKHEYVEFRYYAVSEYGSTTNRPHYHMIAFNLPDWIIPAIDTIWGKGFVQVQKITYGRIHYITKYHVLANKNYEDRENEQTFMSKGIGKSYVETNGKWHKENYYQYVICNGFKQKLPRYYKKKLFTEEELELLRIQQEQFIDEARKREHNRLLKKGIEYPDEYIEQSNIQKASQVYNKAKRLDIL